jgi:outer membrane lipoprotein-sorting protein
MKFCYPLLLCVSLGLPSHVCRAELPSAKPRPGVSQEAARAQPEDALETVLKRMDATAASFHTLEAQFEWDQYFKVVDQTDVQTGDIYFRRVGPNTDMSAVIATENGSPKKKYVIFSDSKVQVYEPSASDLVNVYGTGNNREAVESFLVLGFGGSGHGMLKTFDLTYVKREKANGVDSDEIDLVPKSSSMKERVEHILLWIDLARGISVQQQFFTGEGDYRLAKFSRIELGTKISDAVFKLKKTHKTQINDHGSTTTDH